MSNINILEVNIDNIIENIKIIKIKSNNKKIYAVVKANAYGLGALEIAKSVYKYVDTFCVATIDEGIELRKADIKNDILLLGYVNPKEYCNIEKYNLIANIYSIEVAREIENSGYNIRSHIKIETGHNRLGFKADKENIEKSVIEINEINKIKNIKIEGIFTHLTNADFEDQSFSYEQENRFRQIIEKTLDINEGWIKHISNDAGLIACKFDYNYDAVRTGISMYGVYPSPYLKENYNIGLKDVFSLKSKISHIKEIKKGESISYNRTFVSSKNMKIATVSIGYADGYRRLISNNGYVLINGKKAKIVGVITMDQLMVDISDISCNINDDVILIGTSKDEYIDVEDVAIWANTISYEVMTSISQRVDRLYISTKEAK